MPEVVWVAISSIVGLAALIVSVIAYREKHTDVVTRHDEERIRQITREELAPHILKLTELTTRLENVFRTQQDILKRLEEYGQRIGTVLDRVTVLETKIEVFWKSVAMDAAKIIHSPDPRRAHIDALLEAFMNGTMTTDEESELRDTLAVIRDYEPGVSHLTFPVYPGEQIAAAILLRTMEHAVKKRGQLN